MKTTVAIGDVYECKTFAGIIVHQKITGYYKKDPKEGHHFKAVLVRKKDVAALKKAGVAYSGNEQPSECEGVVFDFQILKKVSSVRKTKSKKRKRLGKK